MTLNLIAKYLQVSVMCGFNKGLLELRKAKGWSQPELAKRIGTSRPIIGRYERGEMMPSIEVAMRLVQVFGVTLDYLVSQETQPAMVQEASRLARVKAIEQLPASERQTLLTVVDSLVRDASARKTYLAA
jgi:transcriptional regulator with XRE-family HTH domain